VQASRTTFVSRTGTHSDNHAHKAIEAAHRRNLGRLERASKAVEDYEVKLGVEVRWTPSDRLWQEAAEKLRKRDYQRTLSNVERLLVSRIFELSKMNLSHTGAPLCFAQLTPTYSPLQATKCENILPRH
jgi:hypothetical protein